MPVIHTKTTYLEMFHPPAAELAPPCGDVRVERAVAPSCEFYRQLYSSVGAELNWVDRLVMPDEQLQAILNDEQIEVSVLYVAGEAAGYSELDRRSTSEVEIAYFGLFPDFIGQGLGRYFLNWTLRSAWASIPKRVWVHTCDLDHPAALPTYLKSGLQVYDEKIVAQPVP